MKPILAAAALAAAVVALPAFAQNAPPAPPGPPPEMMQRWADDRAAMLDADMAGMKAGLRLNPQQERAWPAFEAAVREAAKAREDAIEKEMTAPEEAPDASPIDRMAELADRMAARAATLKKIAEAAKPLYASLDDQQKFRFAMLGQRLMAEQRNLPLPPMGPMMGPRRMGPMGPGPIEPQGFGPGPMEPQDDGPGPRQ